tara:strand:- start:362 stop:991 length:630 start_codon:yes stop_codon:yes gene_type:complete
MANGIYMGGVGMGGEASVDIRTLADQIKAQEKAIADTAAKRKPWQQFGSILSLLSPGHGHVAKFFIDQLAQENIKMPDVDLTETVWTGGEAGKYEESFAEAKEAADPSFVDSLLSELISYGGTEIGGKALGAFGKYAGDWFKNIFKGDESIADPGTWSTAREGGYVPKKYYGGGSVQGGVPTISDYFNMQGKSLGGSNKQSLAEMLGRK